MSPVGGELFVSSFTGMQQLMLQGGPLRMGAAKMVKSSKYRYDSFEGNSPHMRF